MKYSLEHPRCGTGFLLTVIVFSIVFFTPLRVLPVLARLPLQVLLVPVIACLAYEYMRWTASHLDSSFIRALIKPNLALQRLTTRQPTLEMLEVSICSFNSMLALETSLLASPAVGIEDLLSNSASNIKSRSNGSSSEGV